METIDHDIDHGRRHTLWLGGVGMVALLGAGCGGGGDAAGGGMDGSGGGGGAGGGTGSGGAGTGTAADFAGDGAAAAGVPGAAVSAAQRSAALGVIVSAVTALRGSSLRVDPVALAQRLQALSALQRVGISSRGQNVWATFTDGRALVVPNNLEPTAAAPTGAAGAPAVAPLGGRTRALSATPATKAAATAVALALADGDLDTPSLLTAQVYRQLDMFGAVPVDTAPEAAHLCQDFVGPGTLPALRTMARGLGFTLPAVQLQQPPDQGDDNGIEGLRRIDGDGVFFITACAAQVGNDATPRTAICTATPANEATEARYAAELSAGVLTYAVVDVGVSGAWVPQARLAITPAAVPDLMWSFPTECIGILNLTGPAPSDWIDPLRRAGLNHLMGWSRPVSWQRMLAFADDLLQLCLATNNFDGTVVRQNPVPRLRNYGVGEALAYLDTRRLTDDASNASAPYYLQERAASLLVNTLLPTIDYVLIDEDRLTLKLTGQFGRPALGSGPEQRAEIRLSRSRGSGYPEALLSRAANAPMDTYQDTTADPNWLGGSLQTPLGRAQLASGGYLQVFNRGRCSNVVPITHWEVRVQAVTSIDELTLTVDFLLHLRADVRPYRMTPDGAPRDGFPAVAMQSTLDSGANFQASGQISKTEGRLTTTVSWSGSGSAGNEIGRVFVSASGLLATDTRRLPFVLGLSAGEYPQRTLVQRNDPDLGLVTVSDVTEQQGAALGAHGFAPQELAFEFDSRWLLQAGQFEMPATPVDLLGTRQRQTRLRWAAVAADFPPDPAYDGT